MKMNLTKPCSDCPFRNDIRAYLTKKRASEIASALLSDESFSCHKTTTSVGKTNSDSNAQHCAGALIVLEKMNRPNQMMRIMERLRAYDRFKLDYSAPVFSNLQQFVSAQGKK